MKTTLLLLLCLALAGCTTSSSIVTGTARPAILPAAVKVYTTAPPGSEVIGIVKVVSPGEGQWGSDNAVKALKEKAAKVGANGIVFDNGNISLDGWGDTLINAQAVYVP